MRAVQVGAPATVDSLHVAERPEPGPPGCGEILVRLRASSLNYHDFMVVTGSIPTAARRVPMSDGAGEVLAVGDGVTAFKVGDRVVSTFFPDWLDGAAPDVGFTRVPGDGIDGYARDLVVAGVLAFTHAPKGYTHAEAATLTCAGVTAWRALMVDGGLKAGDTVLVQGAGGVSVFALQFAKACGATVIATSSCDEKLERLRALGADHLINYKAEPQWGSVVKGLTDGRGVDHVVEVGGAGTMPQSIIAARAGGHVALIGVLAGFGGPVPTAMMMAKQLHVIGLTVGSRRHQLDMIRAIDATGLKPVIDRSFPLEGITDAFRHQASAAHFGKVAINI